MWQKNFYTGEELERMKSDAEKRVREMRERTQKISTEGSSKGNSEKKQNAAVKEEGKKQVVIGSSSGIAQGLQGLLKNLAIDEEKLVVVLLILVLMREKADSKLILALVWILI